MATKATEIGKKTMQNNDHCAIQGHSRSTLSVPIESPYATSYVWKKFTNIHGLYLAQFPRYGGLQFSVLTGVYLFDTRLGVNP